MLTPIGIIAMHATDKMQIDSFFAASLFQKPEKHNAIGDVFAGNGEPLLVKFLTKPTIIFPQFKQ